MLLIRPVLLCAAVDELIRSLQLIHSRLTSQDDQKQVAQLMPLFQKRAFRHALQAHNKIVAFSLRSPTPSALADATPLNDAVVTRIAASESPLTRELSQLLQTPHFKVWDISRVYSRVPGVAAADYVSTSLQYPWLFPL